MRSIAAWTMVMVMAALVAVTSILACPFLQPEGNSPHGCCSKGHTRGQKCPLSSTEETCPLNLTEAKLGITKDRFDVGAGGAVLAPALVIAPIRSEPVRLLPVVDLDDSSLYLSNRVLRI